MTLAEFHKKLTDHTPSLMRYARALTRKQSDTDDLIQDTLMRALSRGHLWEVGTDFRAWLFTLMHNQFVNVVRKSVRNNEGLHQARMVGDWSARKVVFPNQLHAVTVSDLDYALGMLPPEQRQIILMCGMDGIQYEEAALILDIPVGTVRSRLSRGRDHLAKLMDSDLSHVQRKTTGFGRSRRPKEVYKRRTKVQIAEDALSEAPLARTG